MSRGVYLLLVLMFCLTWSSAFPTAKMAMSVSPPLLFLGMRFAAAGLLLLAWAAIRGELRGRIQWLALGILGVLNQAGYQGLFWLGMRTNSAGLATVIGSLNPIVIAACAAPLLGERLDGRKTLGLVLGLAGALFVVRNRIALGESAAGVIFFAFGLISMVAGTLAFKKMAPRTSLAVTVGAQQFAAGVTLLTVGAATERLGDIDAGPLFWGTMAWFVLVVSVGALMLWFFLLRRGTASAASSLHFLMPPIGLLMSWAAIGEQPHWLDLLGVIPVAAGIILVTRTATARRLTPLAEAAEEV